MFIHPNQEATLLKDENFKSKDKFDGNVVVRGAIGKISGNWIKKSKKVKLVQFEKDNENGTYMIYPKNPFYYDKRLNIASERQFRYYYTKMNYNALYDYYLY